MVQELNHKEIARNLAKAMAEKANDKELRGYSHNVFRMYKIC